MAVNLQYLREVKDRLQYAKSDTDYYFSCSVDGSVLQWGLNSTSLGGYGVNEVGFATVTNKSTYSFSSTLLSAVPLPQQPGTAHLVSVLVISVPRFSTLDLNVSCSNNILIKFKNVKTPKCMGEEGDITTSDDRTIVLQHILSAPLLVNSSLLVHIFMCGTESLFQVIGDGSDDLGFAEGDYVGANVTDLFPDNLQMVNIQAVLISRQPPLVTTSLLFILSNTSSNAYCSFKWNNEIHLPSQEDCRPGIF